MKKTSGSKNVLKQLKALRDAPVTLPSKGGPTVSRSLAGRSYAADRLAGKGLGQSAGKSISTYGDSDAANRLIRSGAKAKQTGIDALKGAAPMNKAAGIPDSGDEAMARLERTILNRAETRAQADALFGRDPEMRKKERATLEALFDSAPASEGRHPQLNKEASDPSGLADEFERLEREDLASNTVALFDKLAEAHDASLTVAQRRFPELQDLKR